MAADPVSPPGARARQGLSLPARTALDVAGRAVGAAFAALAAARRAKPVHPRGVVHEAQIEIFGDARAPAELLRRPRTYRGIIRFSRSAGLPRPLPDVLGLSLRIEDAHGPGRPQDILLVTSLDVPVLRHLLVPTRGAGSLPYSSLLPYGDAGSRFLLGARALSDSRFALTVAPVMGRSHDVGEIRVGARLPDEADAIAFSPWNAGGGLEPDGLLNRLRDYAYPLAQETRIKMTTRTPEEQLVKYLADVHSIEQQALTQMRRAPDLAGDEQLSAAFAEHLEETRRQEERVRARLDAYGASPSTIKDLAGKAGGLGMLLFAASQPDTPGKLTAHAFSYEHMELAAYELLRRAAAAAGDQETERMAIEIAEEERRMAQRLADSFDAAVDASLRDLSPDDLDEQLDKYLADAHAIEQQALQLLESGPGLVDDDGLAQLLRDHLQETREHERRLEERLEARGSSPSLLKDMALRAGGLNIGGFFGAQPDTTPKLAGFAYAFEHIEIAAYELLKRVAERAGDQDTVVVAERTLAEERAMAQAVSATWDRAMRHEIAERAGAAQ